jgi:hypothetical protein
MIINLQVLPSAFQYIKKISLPQGHCLKPTGGLALTTQGNSRLFNSLPSLQCTLDPGLRRKHLKAGIVLVFGTLSSIVLGPTFLFPYINIK